MIKEQLQVYKDDFSNVVKDLKHIKTWYKQIPNLLTISRPIGMIPASILFISGNVIPAIILTGCLLLTDLFDGKLARKWQVTSKLGADLDAIGDKIMFLGMALPIIVTNQVIILNILLEAAISMVNISKRLQGIDTQTINSGKFKTWFLSLLLLIGYITSFTSIPQTILNIIAIITSATQCAALSDYLLKYQSIPENKEIKKLIAPENVVKPQSEKSLNNQNQELINQLTKEKEFLLSTKQTKETDKVKKRILYREKKLH